MQLRESLVRRLKRKRVAELCLTARTLEEHHELSCHCQRQRAAQIFVNNLRGIYPLPDKVVTRSTTSLGEVRDSKFPANLLEICYHDNYEDARWIENSLNEIARNLVLSLTDYFDIPFIWPSDPWEGTVRVSSGSLNLRARPEPEAAIIASIPNGAQVRVYGQYRDWYVVRYGDYVGYASADYIS